MKKDFITATPDSGTESSTVTVTASANSGNARSSSISVSVNGISKKKILLIKLPTTALTRLPHLMEFIFNTQTENCF